MTEQGGIGRDGMGSDMIEKNWMDVNGVRRDVTGGGGRVLLLYDFQTSCNKFYLYLSRVISEIFHNDKYLITKY